MANISSQGQHLQHTSLWGKPFHTETMAINAHLSSAGWLTQLNTGRAWSLLVYK